MTAKTFSTTEFQFSHGTKPRGFGTWIFAPAGQRDNMDAWVTVNCATFTEAKAQVPAGAWIVCP
jgi:hypothetical protein